MTQVHLLVFAFLGYRGQERGVKDSVVLVAIWQTLTVVYRGKDNNHLVMLAA